MRAEHGDLTVKPGTTRRGQEATAAAQRLLLEAATAAQHLLSEADVPEPLVADDEAAGSRTKMGYYASAEEAEQIRAAFLAARAAGKPWRSLSDFQLCAIRERVTQLEIELNSGRPFKGAPAGTLPPGRPLGS